MNVLMRRSLMVGAFFCSVIVSPSVEAIAHDFCIETSNDTGCESTPVSCLSFDFENNTDTIVLIDTVSFVKSTKANLDKLRTNAMVCSDDGVANSHADDVVLRSRAITASLFDCLNTIVTKNLHFIRSLSGVKTMKYEIGDVQCNDSFGDSAAESLHFKSLVSYARDRDDMIVDMLYSRCATDLETFEKNAFIHFEDLPVSSSPAATKDYSFLGKFLFCYRRWQKIIIQKQKLKNVF